MWFSLLTLMKASWQPCSLSQSSFLTIISIMRCAWGCCWRCTVNTLCLLVGSSVFVREQSKWVSIVLLPTWRRRAPQLRSGNAHSCFALSKGLIFQPLRSREYVTSSTGQLADTWLLCTHGVIPSPTQTHKLIEFCINHPHDLIQNKIISISITASATDSSILPYKAYYASLNWQLMINYSILTNVPILYYVTKMCSA